MKNKAICLQGENREFENSLHRIGFQEILEFWIVYMIIMVLDVSPWSWNEQLQYLHSVEFKSGL